MAKKSLATKVSESQETEAPKEGVKETPEPTEEQVTDTSEENTQEGPELTEGQDSGASEDGSQESVEGQESGTSEEGAQDTPEESQEPDAPESDSDGEVKMVKVQNLKGSRLYQASTGIYLGGHEVKLLADDSWLILQIRAGLVKKV